MFDPFEEIEPTIFDIIVVKILQRCKDDDSADYLRFIVTQDKLTNKEVGGLSESPSPEAQYELTDRAINKVMILLQTLDEAAAESWPEEEFPESKRALKPGNDIPLPYVRKIAQLKPANLARLAYAARQADWITPEHWDIVRETCQGAKINLLRKSDETTLRQFPDYEQIIFTLEDVPTF